MKIFFLSIIIKSIIIILILETSQSIEQNNQTCNEHAKAFSESTYEALNAAFDRISPNKTPETTVTYSLEEALKYVISNHLNKLFSLIN